MKDLNSTTINRIPVIAIAGRPNVGKSTLFNRIVGKRKAITDPTPGVTRDPVEEIYRFGGIEAKLVDTGGYQSKAAGLDLLVTNRALEIAELADIVLLLAAVDDFSSLDEEFFEIMRQHSNKILLVVNKVDSESRDDLVYNFYQYGFKGVIGVSAAHGLNIGELEDMIADRLLEIGFVPNEEVEEEERPIVNISIMGQPNTGKSTLLNGITGSELSIVSDIPGTTRDAVEAIYEYKGRLLKFVDTAGIRRKSKVGLNIEYYSVNRSIKTIDDSDVIILMVDAIKGLSDQDKKIAALAAKQGKGIVLAVNKWDAIEKISNVEVAYTDRIRFQFPVLAYAPVVFISALNKEGFDRLLNMSLEVYYQLNKRVETSAMNKALSEWLYDNQPKPKKLIKYKVKFISQVSINPVKFVIWVNRPEDFPEEWVQFARNRIRKDLGFQHVPIMVEVKQS